jgi:hypothetical protein
MGGTRKAAGGGGGGSKGKGARRAARVLGERRAAAAAERKKAAQRGRPEIFAQPVLLDAAQRGAGTAPEPEPEPGAGDGAGHERGIPLVVVSYNILCQPYFEQNPRQRGACPGQCRSQGARHHALMAEIETLTADAGVTAVLCLQEVEEGYLCATLRGALQQRGWELLFAPRRERQGGGVVEGVAVCWRAANAYGAAISVLRHETVDLDTAVLERAAAATAPPATAVGGEGALDAEAALEFCPPSALPECERAAILPKRTGCVALLARLRLEDERLQGGQQELVPPALDSLLAQAPLLLCARRPTARAPRRCLCLPSLN